MMVRVVLAMGSVLGPVALSAWALAAWRLAADLGISGQFAITGGLFSHWQVWTAIAIGLQTASIGIRRYGTIAAVPPSVRAIRPAGEGNYQASETNYQDREAA